MIGSLWRMKSFRGVAVRALAAAITLTAFAAAPSNAVTAGTGGSSKGASARRVEVPEERVNINTASLEQLEALPGVGPALAQRILDYRKQNGPFKKVEDLMNVKGIGEKSFERLKDRITIGS